MKAELSLTSFPALKGSSQGFTVPTVGPISSPSPSGEYGRGLHPQGHIHLTPIREGKESVV